MKQQLTGEHRRRQARVTTGARGTRRFGPFAVVVTTLALLLAACGGQTETVEQGPASGEVDDAESGAVAEPVLVVATTSIIGDLVAQVLGEDGTVRVLMGPGVDPHAYQASAADAAAMRDAELVVANGLLLEDGLVDALAAAEIEGVRVLALADRLDPIPFTFEGPDHAHGPVGTQDDHGHEEHDDEHGEEHGHDEEHGEEHGHDEEHGEEHGHDEEHGEEDDHAHAHLDEDPHFWWDPLRAVTAVELIAAELSELRPEIDWSARADAYAAQILEVHEEMVALFETVPPARRLIVTNHDAFGYLEARYGFEVIGTVIPGSSTLAETNPRAFAELADLLVEEGITVVFADNTDSTTLAEQLAAEAVGRGDLHVEVVRLYTDALGQPGSGAETYLGMLRTTAQLITEVLIAR